MRVMDFNLAVHDMYTKHFPDSLSVAYLSKRLYPDITINFFLAKSKDEVQGGIWHNAMFCIDFMIDTLSGSLPADTTIDSELPANLVLEARHNHYIVKTESFGNYCSSRRVSFRKVTGDAEKILTALDKFCAKLKASVTADMQAGTIHKNYTELLSQKLTGEN